MSPHNCFMIDTPMLSVLFYIFIATTNKARLITTKATDFKKKFLSSLISPPFLKNGGDTHINVPTYRVSY